MASAVAEPLETQFSQINGLAQMTSMNVLGTSTLTWSSNATAGPVINVVASDNDYPLDGAADFHDLATNYVG